MPVPLTITIKLDRTEALTIGAALDQYEPTNPATLLTVVRLRRFFTTTARLENWK